MKPGSRVSRRRLAAGAISIGIAFAATPALASHSPSHAGGGGSLARFGVNPFSDRSEAPRNRVRVTTRWTEQRRPDACPRGAGAPSTGTRWGISLAGEWAPSEAFSVSGALPLGIADQRCDLEDGTGLGDLELAVKLVPFAGRTSPAHGRFGASITLPTGDEDLGLSSGDVGGRVFGGASWERGRWGLFLDAGLGWFFTDDTGLDVDAGVGGAWFPTDWLGILFELRSGWTPIAPPRSTFRGTLSDEVPADGDAALFVGPGLTIRPAPRWVIGVTSRFAVAGDPVDERFVDLDVNFLF